MENCKVDFKQKIFYFEKTPTADALILEIFNDNYKIFERGIVFNPGDVVLDIGANEGMFSILLAKIYPYLRIIALEPVPRTFFQMIRNIGLNGVVNIEPFNLGVGKESRKGIMNVHKEFSGGSSLMDTFDAVNHELVEVNLVPLDAFFTVNYPASVPYLEKIKLLKIDIEGGEYDALYSCASLNKVEDMVAEFHINKRLTEQGLNMNELATWCGAKTNLLYFGKCKMNE